MRLLLLLWLNVLAHCAAAQLYNFRNYTVSDGLPQSEIKDLLQDHRKQIWIATNGGISVFDGNTFRTYNRQQGLASNNTTTLFQDSHKRIWIGSTDNGVTIFDGVDFKVINTRQGLPAAAINSIAEDNMGQVWLATDSGIYRLQGKRFIQAVVPKPQPYQVLHTDATGTIWAGSRSNGLYKIANGKVTHYTTRQQLPSNSITAIYSEKPGGKLWIGTTKGPVYITDNNIRHPTLPKTIQAPAVADFAQDGYGNLLIALQQDGIVSVKKDELLHLTKSNGLSTNQITALLTDAEQNTWIGTGGYGLQQRQAPWFKHYFALNNVTEPHITALTQDKTGNLWVGTANGAAACMQRNVFTTLKPRKWSEGTTLYNLWVVSPDSIWVSSSQGAWNIRRDATQHFTPAHGLPSEDVFAIAADSSNTIWFATAGGVAALRQGRIQPVVTADSSAPGKAYTLFRDKKNRLWVGTDKKAYFLQENQIHPVPALSERSFGKIRSITEDKQGWLYFGGYNYGLLAYHEATGETRLFNAANGLPNEGIKSVYADRNNNLWIATNSKVLKADLPYFYKTKKLRYREYSSQNGFNGLEVSYNGITQTPDGNIWFATIRGLTQYNPALDRINKATPELRLTDIRLSMRPTNWDALGYPTNPANGLPENLSLPYNKNHITFYYHGICLSNPSKVRYRYMLQGHDQQWSESTEQTFATYANLPPGTYTFKIKAQNNDGYWTAKPLSYSFSVVPPVWRREWFIALLLLATMAGIISFVRYREKSLVKMNTLLDMRVQHRTRMLERKNREKELLLQEVHHRVKNNLQIVISLLNLQARHVKDPAALEVMQALRSRVRSMALLHERLYRHDNLEHIDLENYFREVCESLYAAYGVTPERIELYLDMLPLKVDIDTAITLGLIVNELISNSLKYAFSGEGTGKLGITLEQLQDSRYQLAVWDNGVGNSQHNDQQQSFGLQLVSSLVKKLNGTIKFDANNGTKTTIYFTLPS